MAETRVARPLGRDWFLIDWGEVWERLRLAPQDAPGVVPHGSGYAMVKGVATWPTRVHLTHLGALGYEAADGAERWAQFGAPLVMNTPGVTLRSHQIEGIGYIRGRRGTLLADEQRVGKSPQIMYAHNPDAGPLLVVGPLAARAVWHEWAARRFGACPLAFDDSPCSICLRVANPMDRPFNLDAPSFVALSGRRLDGLQLDRALLARVVFLHFAIVPTWRELFATLEKIGTLVVDEAHKAGIQNRSSVTIESIRFLNTIAERAVFATGTPLYNKPRGLWPILDIVTPGAFGKFWDFARRYCDARPTAHGWQAEGATNQEELRERLREVMLRRTWAEIAPGLPPVNRALEVVTLSDAKRDEVEEVAARIRSTTGNAKTAVGDLARLRKLYANEKVLAAVQWAKDAVARGERVILWTWHRDAAERLHRALTGDWGVRAVMPCPVYGPIHGDVPPDERERMIEAARSYAVNPGYPLILIATMATLDTAVNLSFAPHELFVELDWSPTTIAQAEMRPFDGVNPVSATYLVADCDVEQKLADALLTKLGMQDALGLGAGVGNIKDVLRESLGVEDVQTLDALADACIREAA